MPRNKKKQTLVTASPPEDQGNRICLKADDVCVGCIVWLPEQVPNSQMLQCVKGSCSEVLDRGGYNHPVVVLSVRQNGTSKAIGDLIVTIALVSCQRIRLKLHWSNLV
jgi:hypothetical protein